MGLDFRPKSSAINRMHTLLPWNIIASVPLVHTCRGHYFPCIYAFRRVSLYDGKNI